MHVWDDVVVGSGLLGACVGRRLAEAGRRVLVVEGGRAVSDPPGAHLRNAAPLRDNPDDFFAGIDPYFDYFDPDAPAAGLPGAFTTVIDGGIGIAWTNNCPRAVAGVDRPDVLSSSAWDSYYSVAEDLLEVSDGEFRDSMREQVVSERIADVLAPQGRDLQPLPLSGRRLGPERIHFIGPADILSASRARVETIAATVERIDLDGRRPTVWIGDDAHGATNVIVAAGAVESPRLMWRSGIRPVALGRHLSYHPVYIGQIVIDPPISDARGRVDPLPRLGIAPTIEHPWFTMLLRDTNPLPPIPPDLDVADEDLIEVQVFAPVDPHNDNHMQFGGDSVRFHVPLREPDEQRRRAIESDVDELCSAIGRYRAGCEPQWAPLGTPHLMGSCRIGIDDDTSVADPTGLVYGTEGLYLATNGLIPTRLAVNPTLTAAALAIHTADHLATA